jgi:hypothetical protein
VRPSLPESSTIPRADIELYLEKLPTWGEHQGEHVLIHGGKVHGFFPTRTEARQEGFKRFGYVPFLVKKVDLHEKPEPLSGVVF